APCHRSVSQSSVYPCCCAKGSAGFSHVKSITLKDVALTVPCGARIIPRSERGIAQSGSASALGAEGRGFESLCPDQFPRRVKAQGSGLAPVAQLDRAPAF